MVKDFRQTSPELVANRAAASPGLARQRRTIVLAISLSAVVVTLVGIVFVLFGDGWIGAEQANIVALVLFAVGILDLLTVRILKSVWRRRDGA